MSEAMKIRKQHRNIIASNDLETWMAQLERITETVKSRYDEKQQTIDKMTELSSTINENHHFQTELEETISQLEATKLDADSTALEIGEQLAATKLELEENREEIISLRMKKDHFVEEIKKITKTNVDQCATITELQNENEDFLQKCNDMSQTIDSLSDTNAGLTATNDEFFNDNRKLTEKFDELVQTNETFRQTIAEFSGGLNRSESMRSEARNCDSLAELECKICFERDEEKDCLPVR